MNERFTANQSTENIQRNAQNTDEALEAILGHNSAASLATGPVMADPFISPSSLIMTPALSSKYIHDPSFRFQTFLCRITTAGITFFLRSGFPFLTEQIIISPIQAAGNRLSLPLIP